MSAPATAPRPTRSTAVSDEHDEERAPRKRWRLLIDCGRDVLLCLATAIVSLSLLAVGATITYTLDPLGELSPGPPPTALAVPSLLRVLVLVAAFGLSVAWLRHQREHIGRWLQIPLTLSGIVVLATLLIVVPGAALGMAVDWTGDQVSPLGVAVALTCGGVVYARRRAIGWRRERGLP